MGDSSHLVKHRNYNIPVYVQAERPGTANKTKLRAHFSERQNIYDFMGGKFI
jgi:hypothetical protein